MTTDQHRPSATMTDTSRDARAPGGVEAAIHEYARWGTAGNTRAAPGYRAWVCRQDDAGAWQATTYHAHEGDADEARHQQALAAAVSAALAQPDPDGGVGDVRVAAVDLLARFRDFVVVNAKMWTREGGHHNPIWQEVANTIAAAPRPGDAVGARTDGGETSTISSSFVADTRRRYPTSDEIQDWIRTSYREPTDPAEIDGLRFSRWNMEAAFVGGYVTACAAPVDRSPKGRGEDSAGGESAVGGAEAPKRIFDGGSKIIAGLDDALAYARGDTSRARLLTVENGKVKDITPDPAPPTAGPGDLEGLAELSEDALVKLIARTWLTAKGASDENADDLSDVDELSLVAPDDYEACRCIAQVIRARVGRLFGRTATSETRAGAVDREAVARIIDCSALGRWCGYRGHLIAQGLSADAAEAEAYGMSYGPAVRVALAKADQILALVPQPLPADAGAETFDTIAQWCEATFGPVTPQRIAVRANEEMVELLCDPERVEEAADVVIVLSRYPGLWAAVERKMAVNRARTWRLMGDGTGYHVPDAPAPQPDREV